MNFLALFIGLGLERLLTHLFHLREFHWLDPLFDWVYRNQRITQPNLAMGAAALLALLVVLPVGIVEAGLHDRLAYIPQFVFAVFVLLFCLGPRDLGEEINAYCKAVDENDDENIREIADELLQEVAATGEAPCVETALYAQANGRVFGVVFWFVMLGPTGAWLFRVLDLMQRRAVHHLQSEDASGPGQPQIITAVIILHSLFAWLPARLLAVGYMFAGSYDGALAAWKTQLTDAADSWLEGTDALLGAVGRGAAPTRDEGDVVARAVIARDLISRTLWMIWCPLLGLLTLYDLLA
jgi:AmpE protein